MLEQTTMVKAARIAAGELSMSFNTRSSIRREGEEQKIIDFIIRKAIANVVLGYTVN